MILYFSATGNSKYCAEKIADYLNDDLISLNYNIKNNIYEIDCANIKRLGIIAPIFDFDIAWIVADYLEKLCFKNFPKEVYTFAVFTCGGKMNGYAYETLKYILTKKNIQLKSAFTIRMIGNYIPIFTLPSKEEEEKILNEAKELLEKIMPKIKENTELKLNQKKIPKFIYKIIRKVYVPMQKNLKNFWVKDGCDGCELCKNICPKNIIEMKANKPQWIGDNCDCCLACLHRCPKQVIQYGKRTEKKGRYKNPNTNLDFG